MLMTTSELEQTGVARQAPPNALADGWVIRCIGIAAPEGWFPTHCPFSGLFLKAYDPAEGEERWGRQVPWQLDGPLFSWTANLEEAMSFPTSAAAVEKWREPITSNGRPVLRPDGKPQRPLTGFTVEAIGYQEIKDELAKAEQTAGQ